jgi:hypothetical protein
MTPMVILPAALAKIGQVQIVDHLAAEIAKLAEAPILIGQLIQPPSMMWIWPVVKADSSLARYRASWASSSGLPRRPIG